MVLGVHWRYSSGTLVVLYTSCWWRYSTTAAVGLWLVGLHRCSSVVAAIFLPAQLTASLPKIGTFGVFQVDQPRPACQNGQFLSHANWQELRVGHMAFCQGVKERYVWAFGESRRKSEYGVKNVDLRRMVKKADWRNSMHPWKIVHQKNADSRRECWTRWSITAARKAEACRSNAGCQAPRQVRPNRNSLEISFKNQVEKKRTEESGLETRNKVGKSSIKASVTNHQHGFIHICAMWFVYLLIKVGGTSSCLYFAWYSYLCINFIGRSGPMSHIIITFVHRLIPDLHQGQGVGLVSGEGCPLHFGTRCVCETITITITTITTTIITITTVIKVLTTTITRYIRK